MSRETAKANAGRRAKARRPRPMPRHEAAQPKRFEPATGVGVNKQKGPSNKSPFVVADSDPATGLPPGQPARPRKLTVSPVRQFDAAKVASLIEACRARVASLSELAGVITRTLFELYDYESDDPELWQCCYLLCHVLKQAQAALIPLGIISRDTSPLARAAEVAAGCEAQRQWLRPAVHVVRATIYILIDVKFDYDDEILPALRDLEHGLARFVNDLERVIQCCPGRPGKRGGR